MLNALGLDLFNYKPLKVLLIKHGILVTKKQSIYTPAMPTCATWQ